MTDSTTIAPATTLRTSSSFSGTSINSGESLVNVSRNLGPSANISFWGNGVTPNPAGTLVGPVEPPRQHQRRNSCS